VLKTRAAERSTQLPIAWKLIAYAVAPVMAPNSRVSTDAQRHDQDGECGEARTPAQIAAGIPEIP